MLEYRFMSRLDMSPSIIEWSSEEMFIRYYDPTQKKWRRYFPDFVYKSKKGNVIKTFMIEIKPESQTKPPKKTSNKKRLLEEQMTFVVNQSKWAFAEKYCQERGIEFLVITEKDIEKL